MSSENPRDSPPGRRRSSFVELFGARPPPNPIQSNQPRRLSITTLGLSTIPGSTTTPYTTMRARAESVSSANSGSVDESPFEDDPPPSASMSSPSPITPFNRRRSFGAKAMLDPRGGGSTSPNGPPGSTGNGTSRPSVTSSAAAAASHKASASPVNKSREGFDFAENMRARAERTSISGSFVMPPVAQHHRSKSVAVMEPPREPPKQQKGPDAFQERILKGDFYMD